MYSDRTLLVYSIINILLAVFIIITGPLIVENVSFLLVQGFGILLIVWSLIAIKINKHYHGTKLPDKIFFITHGPYEIIRHPIYAGFLLIMSGFIQGSPSVLRFLAFGILFISCLLKIIREEYILEHYIEEYPTYKKKTRLLIPYFF
jgi:protein-S-isoprenylcysteine O-methyltransferase Ste14